MFPPIQEAPVRRKKVLVRRKHASQEHASQGALTANSAVIDERLFPSHTTRRHKLLARKLEAKELADVGFQVEVGENLLRRRMQNVPFDSIPLASRREHELLGTSREYEESQLLHRPELLQKSPRDQKHAVAAGFMRRKRLQAWRHAVAATMIMNRADRRRRTRWVGVATELENKLEQKSLSTLLDADRRYYDRERRVLHRHAKRERSWRRVKEDLARKTNRNVSELSIEKADAWRQEVEEADLIVKAVPHEERYSASVFEQSLRNGGERIVPLGSVFSGLVVKVKPEINPLPETVRKVGGAKLETLKSKHMQFRNARRKELGERITKLRPYDLEHADDLIVEGQTLISFSARRLPRYHCWEEIERHLASRSCEDIFLKEPSSVSLDLLRRERPAQQTQPSHFSASASSAGATAPVEVPALSTDVLSIGISCASDEITIGQKITITNTSDTFISATASVTQPRGCFLIRVFPSKFELLPGSAIILNATFWPTSLGFVVSKLSIKGGDFQNETLLKVPIFASCREKRAKLARFESLVQEAVFERLRADAETERCRDVVLGAVEGALRTHREFSNIREKVLTFVRANDADRLKWDAKWFEAYERIIEEGAEAVMSKREQAIAQRDVLYNSHELRKLIQLIRDEMLRRQLFEKLDAVVAELQRPYPCKGAVGAVLKKTLLRVCQSVPAHASLGRSEEEILSRTEECLAKAIDDYDRSVWLQFDETGRLEEYSKTQKKMQKKLCRRLPELLPILSTRLFRASDNTFHQIDMGPDLSRAKDSEQTHITFFTAGDRFSFIQDSQLRCFLVNHEAYTRQFVTAAKASESHRLSTDNHEIAEKPGVADQCCWQLPSLSTGFLVRHVRVLLEGNNCVLLAVWAPMSVFFATVRLREDTAITMEALSVLSFPASAPEWQNFASVSLESENEAEKTLRLVALHDGRLKYADVKIITRSDGNWENLQAAGEGWGDVAALDETAATIKSVHQCNNIAFVLTSENTLWRLETRTPNSAEQSGAADKKLVVLRKWSILEEAGVIPQLLQRIWSFSNDILVQHATDASTALLSVLPVRGEDEMKARMQHLVRVDEDTLIKCAWSAVMQRAYIETKKHKHYLLPLLPDSSEDEQKPKLREVETTSFALDAVHDFGQLCLFAFHATG